MKKMTYKDAGVDIEKEERIIYMLLNDMNKGETVSEDFKKDYNKIMFAYPFGQEDEDLPKCDNRILCIGSNVCLGNEPYSCERMFRDYGCPRGYKKKCLK